jgi:hypothetical protein
MTQSTTRRAMAEVDYTMSEVDYTIDDNFQDGGNHKKCSQFSDVIKELGDQRDSYDTETPELYDPKKKIVKKGRGARAIEWLSNHHPFKCCCGTSDDDSKFEMSQADFDVYDI